MSLGIGMLSASGGGAAPTSTLARVSATQSVTAAIVCPTVQAGDLLLFSNSCGVANAPPLVTPSGFTLINNQLAGSGTFYRHSIFYKKATGSEGGTTLAGMSGDNMLISLGVFRKTPAITGVSLSAVNAEGNFGTNQLANQTVLSGAGVAPLLIIGNYGIVTQAVATGSMSPAQDDSYVASGSVLYDLTRHKFYANSPLNALVTMDTSGYPSTNLRKSMRSFFLSLS